MVEVRVAKPADAPALAAIMVQSFRTAFRELVSEEIMDQCADLQNCTAMLAQVCENTQIHSYLAVLDGKPCGELFWRGEAEAELIALHTLPEVWGYGVGAALLLRAQADMNAAGVKRVKLWAFRENHRARRFYEKYGLRASGAERISEFDGAVEVCYEKELQL